MKIIFMSPFEKKKIYIYIYILFHYCASVLQYGSDVTCIQFVFGVNSCFRTIIIPLNSDT